MSMSVEEICGSLGWPRGVMGRGWYVADSLQIGLWDALAIPAADLQGLSLIPLDRIPLVLAAGTVDGFSGGMTGVYGRVKFLDVTVPYLSKRLELEG